MLLDEADVFLMKRDWAEVNCNSLVSVFLRKLEYYSGILFLTTNRPGTIDEAFKSRIHISLCYPNTDLASTKQMWTDIMRRLEKENELAEIKVVFDKNKLLAFAEKHYKRCERQRRHGMAVKYATPSNPPSLWGMLIGRFAAIKEAGLTPEQATTGRHAKKWMRVKRTVNNFRSISKTTNEFEDYTASLREEDSQLAREAEVRDDNYDPDRPAVPAVKNDAPSLFMTRPTGISEVLGGTKVVKRKGKGEAKAKVEESEDEEDDDDDIESVSEDEVSEGED
ncbi:hypothetical protein B0T18DRAFT_431658 [Schizothecium vesticola]|uniref:ATPase AAA-type core domain-containing protein n=1 Tax=Schizothecium vesticola TaxID=314040 RepID=A0AA40EJ66_9PEZI|nr:hypothetical protein B0T18DRAFT_431658 [Schizothecium vesticola]